MTEIMTQQPDGSWNNEGDFTLFRCYYCLSAFKDPNKRDKCEKSHPVGTMSQQMGGHG
jgi:hypothetical protein